MATYQAAGKSARTISRENYTSSTNVFGDDLYKITAVGALCRLADATERIAAVLECRNARNAAAAIVRMDARMAKRTPLGRGKRRTP